MNEKVKISIYENFVHIFEKKQVNFSGAAKEEFGLDVPLAAELESLAISSDKNLEILEITKTNPNFEDELRKNLGKKINYGKDSGILVEIQPNLSMTLKTKKGFLLIPISYSYLTLPNLPKLNPQVIASCEAEKGMHNITISYLASGFTSSTTFILTLKKNGAELQGYFIITNSIKDFEKAQITIISGKVNKISYGYYPIQNQYAQQNSTQNYNIPAGLRRAGESNESAPYEGFNQEASEEYRTFSLSDRLVDLKKGQVSKIKFFQKDKINFERKYVLPIQRQNYGQSIKRSANVVVVIKNSKENGLGFPLPNGLFKVYGENELFIGESYANPTPSGSEAKILIGSAFDIVYDVKNLSHRVENVKLDISEYEVKIRNSKTTEEEVIIEFPLIYYANNYGYEMKSADLKFDKISAQLLRAKTKINSKEEKTFRFEITERMYY